MNAHKGLSSTMKIGGMLVITLLLVAGMVGGAALFMQGSVVGDDSQDPSEDNGGEVTDARWDDRKVKYNVELENLASDTITSGTLHYWSEEPENWENEGSISDSYGAGEGYSKQSIDGDGITTIQENPGTYYVATEVSGDYPTFFTIEIPDGSEDRFQNMDLSEYNENPLSRTFDSADIHSLSSKSYDLGIDSNSTSTQEYVAYNTYRPNDDTEYRAGYMLIEPGSESGGVDPTSDSDGNEVYDEGISKSWVEVSGAVDQNQKKTEVFFQPGAGIDELVGDDRARIDLSEFVFDDSNAMTVAFGIKASESEDGTDPADGDEKASDGERFFDIKFVDAARNVNSVAGITG